jgi:hypothetical protein
MLLKQANLFCQRKFRTNIYFIALAKYFFFEIQFQKYIFVKIEFMKKLPELIMYYRKTFVEGFYDLLINCGNIIYRWDPYHFPLE